MKCYDLKKISTGKIDFPWSISPDTDTEILIELYFLGTQILPKDRAEVCARKLEELEHACRTDISRR